MYNSIDLIDRTHRVDGQKRGPNVQRYLLVVVALVLPLLAIGCAHPFGEEDGAQEARGDRSTPESETGRVVVEIPAISPLLSDFVDRGTEIDRDALTASGSNQVGGNAFFFATTAEARLYDSEGQFVASQTGSGDNLFDSVLRLNFSDVPYGSGYSVDVDVYNSYVTPDTPVTTGTSAPFTVLPGTRVSTTVGLIPYSPQSVSAGVDTNSNLTSCVYDQGLWELTSLGAEAWYEIVPTASEISFVATPSTDAYAYVVLYDTTGKIVDGAVSESFFDVYSTQDAAAMVAEVNPGETYYLGLITLSDTAMERSVTLRWDNGNPVEADGEEDNESSETAKSIGLDETKELSFHDAGDEDWFSFAATAGTTYRIWTQEPSSGYVYGAGDTELTLYDTDGTTELEYSDDYAERLYSSIEFAPTETATFYVKATELDGGIGNYALTLSEAVARATTLEIIDSPTFDGKDFSIVAVPEDGDPSTDVVAEATGTVGEGSVTMLEDGTDTPWSAFGEHELYGFIDMDGSGLAEPTPGDYQLWDKPIFVDGTTAVILNESMQFIYLPPMDEYEPDDVSAPTINVGDTQERTFHLVDGSVLSFDTRDYASFMATEGITYVISTATYGDQNTPLLELRSENGLEATNEDELDRYSQIVWTAPATAEYRIEISTWGIGRRAEYSLSLAVQ